MGFDEVKRHTRFTPMRQVLTRRDCLERISFGLGGIALSSLLGEALGATPRAAYDVLLKRPHFTPKAKQVILLFQNGGPSQVDLFDPKPELTKHSGKKPGDGYVNTVDPGKTGTWLSSPFRFSPHGQSGMVLSEVLPGLAKHVDEIALIRSMVTVHSNHEQALRNINTGRIDPGRPALGSWIAYGLGTENQSLPAYVAILNPSGLPVDGVKNFSSGWLPPLYQGMAMRAEGAPVLNLETRGSAGDSADRLALLQQLNRAHMEPRRDQLELEARIASFELAARMQVAASDALDLSKEALPTRELYGTENEDTAVYARQCLLARRLVERGVRFVQVFHQSQPWDTHKENEKGTKKVAGQTDQPVAALLTDLKQRGLLDETLVIWAGEFGRTPMAEDKDGRDHHKYAFSLWMAGGGIKGGVTYGATDDFAYRVVEDPVTTADYHATILHLLGLDHKRLTFPLGSRDESLTDVHSAKVVNAILM